MGKAILAMCLATAASFAGGLCAQSPFPAGQTDVSWSNTGSVGTPVLGARVHYPAVSAGVDVAPAARPGGWPTLVFAHGYATVGDDYGNLGAAMAANGYVVVMLNTAFVDPVELDHDVRATYGAILTANAATGTLLEGAFDTARIGVFGHSMGASVTCWAVYEDPGNPLDNPGYKCAFSISPLDPGIAAQSVTVPYGLISGEGDTITPAGPNADVLYDNLSLAGGCKLHYHMGPACDHLNVAGLSLTPPDVFDRTVAIVTAFFDEFLADAETGLDGALGAAAVADPNLMTLEQEWYSVRTWNDRPLQVGQTTRLQVGTGNGVCGLVAASMLAAAPLPTPFGDILVDPGSAFVLDAWITITNRYDLDLPIPNTASLAGVTLAVQGFGTTVFNPLTLATATDALGMTIAP